MKLSVSSYSFSRLFTQGMTQMDCIARAKEMGFDAIEFAELLAPEGMTREEYASRLGEEARRVGLEVSNFAVGADLLRGNEDDRLAEVNRLKGLVDCAVLLGAPCMRHDVTSGFPQEKTGARGFDDALPVLADACRRVTAYAQEKGVRTLVENHGLFCQDSERVEKLVNAVNHPNYGWLVDMGNFLCVDENPATAVGRAAPYASYVHAKDFHVKSGREFPPGEGYFRSRGGNYLRGAIIGHGQVPVNQCLSVLKNSGFDGTIAIEFEGMEDPLLGIRVGLDNLRRILKALGAA